MARADASSIVAVEEFVEQDVVPPMRVALKFFGAPVNRPPAVCIACKGSDQTICNFLADFKEVHQLAGSCRTLNPEIVSVVLIQVQERPDKHDVDWHPYRAAPVRVPPKHSGVRFGRDILHPVLLTTCSKHILMV